MINRRQFLAAAGALVARAQQRKPNIVLLFADDLGYADLHCTGDPITQTPHLDKLASEGVRLTDFVVAWPACTPSRSALLTGRYPQRNGLYDMIRNNEVNFKYQFTEETYATSPEMTLGMDTREITIGQAMQSAGYRTGVVGKWDGGRARRYLPLQRGFDFYYGFANTGIDYYTHERYGVPSMFRGNERIKEEGHATDLFQREAIRFIRENKDRPFFLYVPFNAPHGASTFDKSARQSPEKYLKMYEGKSRAAYRALVTHLDDAVGAILAELRAHGLEDNTLVIFTSDNGGTGKTNGPLRGGKGSMWEGGYREPFIARWPGRIPAGRVVNDFVASMDLFPTFTALAGAKPGSAKHGPAKLDGFDVMPVLEGKGKSKRTEMYWQRQNDKSARSGKWKWMEQGGKESLFDLQSDPGEARDLAASNPAELARMRGKWKAWRKEMDDGEPRGPFRDY